MSKVYTVGHSTRELDELVGMLQAHGVAGVADVRRFAGSRRLPQFNAEHLAATLPTFGMTYLPCPLLGGRRKPDPGSANTGWRKIGRASCRERGQGEGGAGDFVAKLSI